MKQLLLKVSMQRFQSPVQYVVVSSGVGSLMFMFVFA